LALWALAKDYGKTNLVCSGPLYAGMAVEGSRVRVRFSSVGAGLIVGSKSGRAPVQEQTGGKLARFAIAGVDKKWFWADAVIDGATVVVSSPQVTAPVAVRYAFAQNPAGCNLYNRDGLPASPFRTDDW
jgi:sialate O-acetylesterase